MIYYIAIIFMLNTDIVPYVVDGPMNMENCHKSVAKLNQSSPLLKEPRIKAIGGKFVCLHAENPHA